MVEPVSLEVCYFGVTRLKLWTNQYNSSQYDFQGQLVDYQDGWLRNKPVKVYFNDTLTDTITTDQYGMFYFSRNINPGDSRIAYTVRVVFEGELRVVPDSV